jgi:GR25 family glycosyltransferase involved in LPS biosynthesis
MMIAEITTKSWEFFDKIYCISLDERTDRRADATAQFEKVGLTDKVEFVIVKKHPHNIEEGIFESHLTCMKKGIRAGADTIVIFEDDILFDRFSPVVLKNCVGFLSSTEHWSALFFGCLVSNSKKTENRSILRVKYRCLSHGYVLNRQFAESLIKTQWQGAPYDEVLKNWPAHFYAAHPAFAFQSNSRTDNNRNMGLDRFRRLFGGLGRIQKWNEFYHRHKVPIMAAHAIIILIILKVVL